MSRIHGSLPLVPHPNVIATTHEYFARRNVGACALDATCLPAYSAVQAKFLAAVTRARAIIRQFGMPSFLRSELAVITRAFNK
jgi:hypothetical protein